jgi:dihydrofolate synthase / folylpolyglutamate synthase
MLTYEAALDYIYRFTDYEQKSATRYAPENFNLARMERLLVLLGDPQGRFPCVHVAGTKGKGSTSAMIASILEAAGYRTGLFTSPHLHTFRERIRVDGGLIRPQEVADLIEQISPCVEQVPGITTFEIITAMALVYFLRRKVDVAILEVGLGGRLDATNVVTPEVAVITSLSYDHMYLLGNTLAEIAREKAGIIKPGIPVVSSPQENEALLVVESVACERNAPLTLVGRDWLWERGEISLDGQHFQVTSVPGNGAVRSCSSFWIPLLGAHQVVNATTAVAAVAELGCRGFRISDGAMALGLHRVYWPGRLEVLSREPMLVVDSAHNADSAHKLVVALREYFGRGPIILIFGASNDKDIDGMLREFIPNVQEIIFVRSEHARAADAARLHEQAVALGGNGTVVEDLDEALSLALQLSGPSGTICGAGSVFVAGGLREAWATRMGVHLAEWD